MNYKYPKKDPHFVDASPGNIQISDDELYTTVNALYYGNFINKKSRKNKPVHGRKSILYISTKFKKNWLKIILQNINIQLKS